MHRKVAAALVAALALGVASCGGSDETLTRAEVVSRLETACRQAQARSEKAGREARGQNNFFVAILAGQRQLVSDLEGIEGSDEVADDVDTLRSSLAERAELIDEIANASRAEQQRTMNAVEDRVAAASDRIEAVFRRLGARSCA